MDVPNFSKLPIEHVLELRYEKSWCIFRDFIRDIVSTVKDGPEIMTNSDEFEKVLTYNYTRVLSHELQKKYTTGTELGMDLALGATSLIPVFGVIPTTASLAKSLKGYWDDKSTWFAFLLRLKGMS